MPSWWRQLPSPAPASTEGYMCGTTEGQHGSHQQACSVLGKSRCVKGALPPPSTYPRRQPQTHPAPTPPALVSCTQPGLHGTTQGNYAVSSRADHTVYMGARAHPRCRCLGPSVANHARCSSVRAGEAITRGLQRVGCCGAAARAITMSGKGVCAAFHTRSKSYGSVSQVGFQCTKI